MLILALDTATPATTVAVVADGTVLAERTHVDPRRHAEVLAPAVAEVLAASGVGLGSLDAVVVGVGPGAYTGLRVGLVTAMSLGNAVGVPVRGVVTLDAMAHAAGLAEPFVVVTDARRKEVFWARYAGGADRVAGPEVARPDDVVAHVVGLPVVGAAGTPFADRFPGARGPDLPAASALGLLAAERLARGEALLPPVPRYLRRPDVTPSTGPKPVSRP